MLILALLKYAATSSCAAATDEVADALTRARPSEIQWALQAGLGALLYRAVGSRAPACWHDTFLSAHLTAQVLSGARIDTAKDVIRVCNECGSDVTLLKGISISDQFYPAPHCRPMSDIDVLVPKGAGARIETELVRRGYVRAADSMGEDPHHGVPLNDPTRTVWVEIHTALYPRRSGLLEHRTFASDNVAAEAVRSAFHGSPCNYLTPELQLPYIASSWMYDLTLFGVQPSFVVPLFDAVFLLSNVEHELCWPHLLEFLDNELAESSLDVLLSYLVRRGLCPSSISRYRGDCPHAMGFLELRAIHAMIDRFVIGGRRWNLPLPPPVPGRYNLRLQLAKRWPSRGPAT